MRRTSLPDRRLRRSLRVVIGSLGLLLFADLGAARAAEPGVIVNQQTPVTTLERKDLRAIFTLRRRTWPDGSPITIYVLPDTNSSHQRFAKDKLRLYPYQLRQRWDRTVFSGTGAAPIEVKDEQAMLAAIAKKPGAIGYSELAQLPGGVKAMPENKP